jgi:hypothetical protein
VALERAQIDICAVGGEPPVFWKKQWSVQQDPCGLCYSGEDLVAYADWYEKGFGPCSPSPPITGDAVRALQARQIGRVRTVDFLRKVANILGGNSSSLGLCLISCDFCWRCQLALCLDAVGDAVRQLGEARAAATGMGNVPPLQTEHPRRAAARLGYKQRPFDSVKCLQSQLWGVRVLGGGEPRGTGGPLCAYHEDERTEIDSLWAACLEAGGKPGEYLLLRTSEGDRMRRYTLYLRTRDQQKLQGQDLAAAGKRVGPSLFWICVRSRGFSNRSPECGR